MNINIKIAFKNPAAKSRNDWSIMNTLTQIGYDYESYTNQNYDDLKIMITRLAANGLSFELINRTQTIDINVFKE